MMILTLCVFPARKKRKTLGDPENSQYKMMFRYNTALAEQKANFGWNVSCKHGIISGHHSMDRVGSVAENSSPWTVPEVENV